MIWPVALALAVGTASPELPSAGAHMAMADVAVEILRPIAVRQASGPFNVTGETPHTHLTRQAGIVLVEFE